MRKIIHFDMDAFYASIEQRERPEWQGKPLIIGGDPHSRGVVATCSYEARRFGVHSAMPARKAYQLCPQAIFVRPRMDLYKTVSAQIMDIFKAYTDLVEPLSLDEAFLDVTTNKKGLSSATTIARQIKAEIYTKTKLTGSAGVSINKCIAKIASDYHKPDGLTVITPEKAQVFLEQVPIRNFFGVGKVTEQILHEKKIYTGSDLKTLSERELYLMLGKKGRALYRQVRGVDDRPVNPNRIRKSVGKETTLQKNLSDRGQMLAILEELALNVEALLKERKIRARVLTMKLRFHDFQLMTRRKTIQPPYQEVKVMMEHVRHMLNDLDFQGRSVRLLGVSASHLISEDALAADSRPVHTADRPRYEQLSLFDAVEFDPFSKEEFRS